jgi:hypothetical protein
MMLARTATAQVWASYLFAQLPALTAVDTR